MRRNRVVGRLFLQKSEIQAFKSMKFPGSCLRIGAGQFDKSGIPNTMCTPFPILLGAPTVATPRLDVKPIDTQTSFRTQAYNALKQAITSVNIYAQPQEIRLDERQLSQDLGVSRTPIREAMTLLEQEGFVKTLPRRGIFVVRKTKKEIVEMIQVWAALESLAARLITLHAPDADIASLRHLFDEFRGAGNSPEEHLGEYSDANIKF